MQESLKPITADDETIRAALEAAHIPSLMNALVHITGDTSIIRGDIKPTSAMFGDPQGGVTPDQQADIRERAFEALTSLRDDPRPVAVPDAALVKEMLQFIVGSDLSDDYVELAMSELAIDGADPFGTPGLDAIPEADRAAFEVVIVGAGMSGLLAAIRLQEAGIGFTIIEKNANVGGTWYENRYPGCRVDSPNHTYSYSFAPNDWPQHFSQQQVLLDYFDEIATRYDLRKHIRFETEVRAARFDAATSQWQIDVASAAGDDTLRANALIAAVGQLNRPRLPEIPGREDYEGIAFHSAVWEHEHDLQGKHIAVIGTGASAFQFVPEIAKTAAKVTVFQRTPPWVAPRAEYHDYVSEGKHWLLNHVPFYAKWFRFNMFWTTGEGILAMVKRDPSWNETDRSVSEANDQLRALLTENIKTCLADRPDLIEIATPDYPPAGKRMLVDNGHWFRALLRDNVEIVTDPIAEMNATGVKTASGRQVDADVIVYGTGFQANKLLFPMEIYGSDGVELRSRWGNSPRAYRGISVPGYPNLFCLYGPNTNIVVNSSIIFFSECEVRYIMGCIKHLLANGLKTMDCRQDVHDEYNVQIDERNRLMAWGSDNVRSWYKNEDGRVTQNWPGSQLEFWQQTKEPDPNDYVFG